MFLSRQIQELVTLYFHIDNIQPGSIGKNPKNIFFLADSFGILPPISRLTQKAAYHFISGYTAKVAGTEAGVTEPQPNFSACLERHLCHFTQQDMLKC
jgi:ATP-dependent phosphoenolpyruvate carboxykinase